MRIDWWTLGLQTVNIAILIGLLGRFFWRPVATIIEERRAAAATLLADAEAKRAEAAKALQEVDQIRAGFAREREELIAAARQEAEREKAAILAEAAKMASKIEEDMRNAVRKEQEAAQQEWATRAGKLASEIAKRLLVRLLGRLDAPQIRQAFFDSLIAELEKLPDLTKQSMVTNGAALEAVSATSLDAGDEEKLRLRLAEILHAAPQIGFKTEPGLIAGLELRGPHLVIANSWRADLDHIMDELRA